MHRMRSAVLHVVVAFGLSAPAVFAANVGAMAPAVRPDHAAPLVDVGRADGATFIEDALVRIPLTAEAEARLQVLLRDQQDPSSSRYHRWVTPEEFGELFGAQQGQVDALVAGLRAQGLRPGTIAKSRAWVRFSGQAADLERAFGRQVRRLQSDSEMRLRLAASTTATTAPLAAWSGHVFLPDDLRANAAQKKVAPAYTEGSAHALAPADFVTIYNVGPIYQAGYRGADSTVGVNIAVVGQSEIDLADVKQFRQTFALPANDPIFTNVGTSPGKTGDQVEGDLDVQWAGAIAPLATIRYYVANAAGSAALQAVDDNMSSILSVSFGLCETQRTDVANAYDALWAQAASQGITVLVSSGDSGASGCDGMSSTSGSGQAVNLICSGNATCVGGTQFNDTANPSAYWSASNDPSTYGSARSYIPEIGWNESGSFGGSGLASSGGGVSTLFTRPSWQVAPGVPGGMMRVEPDIAATAGYIPYLVFSSAAVHTIVGTSAAAPSVAGFVALLRQRFGRLGNINSMLYQLARAQYSGSGAIVFHDVTGGSNSVPAVTGYSCGVGYDLVTGLGSIDAGALMNAMAGSGTTPTAPCVASTTTACILNNRFKVNVRYRGVFDNNAADTDAQVKNVGTTFANPSYETAFFYFNSSNNIEMMIKMLDQGNTNSSGQPTIAVLFGSATPLRIEMAITDTQTGTMKRYTSAFNTQAGQTDFTAFVK